MAFSLSLMSKNASCHTGTGGILSAGEAQSPEGWKSYSRHKEGDFCPAHYPGSPSFPSPPPAPPPPGATQRCPRSQPRPSDGPRTVLCVDSVLKERPTTPSSRRRAMAVGGASVRVAVLGSGNPDPGVYPTAGPCSSASPRRNLGLCCGLQYARCTSPVVA